MISLDDETAERKNKTSKWSKTPDHTYRILVSYGCLKDPQRQTGITSKL